MAYNKQNAEEKYMKEKNINEIKRDGINTQNLTRKYRREIFLILLQP